MDNDSLRVPHHHVSSPYRPLRREANSVKFALQRISSAQTSSSSIQSLQRRLRNVSLRRTTSDTDTDFIGSIGLTSLFVPEEVFADFIFVHGLKGGSRKTWSFSPDPAHYWPKEWLPGDPDFKHVRIHTFGYHSDWGETKGSNFNIHDFGQNLVEEIQSSPTIGRSHEVPIVLIGHSMGGLVIKEAVIQSRQNPEFKTIGDRIHSLYFLAVPHRGSDLAKVLNNVLKMAFHKTKNYVTNLERNSEAQQVINNSFRHFYKGIHIHSFLESVPMSLGYDSILVVDRGSATLGYPEEHLQVLKADHRSICKFDTPLDANYQSLRNKLAATVHDIVRNHARGMQELHREQMRKLSSYLNINDAPIDDLQALDEQKLEGSCEWLTNKESLQDWQYNDNASKCFWLRGKPAMGKSMLSSHVINYLEGTQCSFFFFKHADRMKSSLAVFLRSMAYQMASTNRSIRHNLIELQHDDPFLEMENARNIWRKVFGVIFKTQFHQPHYWVIDALDECKAAESHDFGGLFGFLSKIDKEVPLRLFVTSRFSSELDQLIAPLRPITEQVTAEDTAQDIRSYVEQHSDGIPVEEDEQKDAIIEIIISKASGCFLWAVLVIRQLQDIIVYEDIEQALSEVPIEMEGLYTRNLENLAKKPKYKRVATSILNWAVCSMRALSVPELKDALKLDINQTISRDLEKLVHSLSGHMVSVDRHSRVQTVHQTATAFLTNEELDSEFRVEKVAGNVRLAKTCLKYLCGDEMQMQKKRKSSAAASRKRSNEMCQYACAYFSEHILRATSEDEELLQLLTTFLQTNILTWIEFAAQQKRLDFLTQAAKHLKAYGERRAKITNPLDKQLQLIDDWSIDLGRIAGEFGPNLINDPSAIYSHVSPLCPSSSIISRQFAASLNTFQVTGLSAKNWDDRVACLYYPDDRAESVTCRDGRFAVGFSNGNIIIYYGRAYQEATRLYHGEGVLLMELGSLAALLVSASRKSIKLWNVATGSVLISHDIAPGFDPLTLCINDESTKLMVANTKKEFIQWDIPSGNIERQQQWAESGIMLAESTLGRPPTVIKINMEARLLAVTYRSLPVFMWDLDTFELQGTCFRPTERRESAAIPITDMVFNPNPDVELLAVAYMASELVLYDSYSLEFVTSIPSECDILVASADGRFLAGGDSSGRIQLYEFDTLQLLTQISLPDYGVKAMRFSNDGQRLFDLRDCECNVWEPSALMRTSAAETASESSDTYVTAPTEVSARPLEDIPTISAMSLASKADFAVCGNDHGRVILYDLPSGNRRSELYKHARNVAIRSVQWDGEAGIVSTADVASRLQVVQLAQDPTKGWKKKAVLLDERLGEQVIRQQLLSPDATKLLVATSKFTILYDLVEKRRITQTEVSYEEPWPWVNYPSKPDLLFLLERTCIRIFHWQDLSPTLLNVQLNGYEGYDIDYQRYALSKSGGKLLMKFTSTLEPPSSASSPRVHQITTLDLSLLGQSKELRFGHYFIDPNTLDIELIIGTTTGVFNASPMLLFLTKSGEVCSIDLEKVGLQEGYTRHFFVPAHWLSGTNRDDLIVRVTEKGEVVFVRRDELAVFRGALGPMRSVSVK